MTAPKRRSGGSLPSRHVNWTYNAQTVELDSHLLFGRIERFIEVPRRAEVHPGISLQHATGAITRPAADAPLLAGIVGRVDGNLAEPLIGVGLRIIRNRVGVPQIFAN